MTSSASHQHKLEYNRAYRRNNRTQINAQKRTRRMAERQARQQQARLQEQFGIASLFMLRRRYMKSWPRS
jgi:hypothetical protein